MLKFYQFYKDITVLISVDLEIILSTIITTITIEILYIVFDFRPGHSAKR